MTLKNITQVTTGKPYAFINFLITRVYNSGKTCLEAPTQAPLEVEVSKV